MLQDVVHTQDQQQIPVEEISSPVSAQMFEFYDPELFPEALQNNNSEVTSCSNCCYEENSSYNTSNNLSCHQDVIEHKFNSYKDNNGHANTASMAVTTSTASTTTMATIAPVNNNNNLSIMFDSPEIENDISASIDFSQSPKSFPVQQFLTNHQDQYDFSSMQPQIQLQDHSVSVVEGLSSQYPTNEQVASLMAGGPLPSLFEGDCLSSAPSYLVPLNHSSQSFPFLGPTISAYMPVRTINAAALSSESSGIYSLMRPELQQQELDYQGDNTGLHCQDSMQRLFNPGDVQVLSNENQQLVAAAGNTALLGSEISMEVSTYKVGKLSAEARKEKIHRYMKKRNERNFSKKIKYACRKMLADSRPRVRGRFAKNDEFGETPRAACSHQEDDNDEEVVVKEEEEMVDSSDIFAHISGVNSFKCNYHLQSWI